MVATAELMPPEILLVDDNEVQGATRSIILSRLGLKVAVIQKAQDAIALLDRMDVRCTLRLLITDHLMPEMNGSELVRIFRHVLPSLPVLVLSGLDGAEAEYQGLNVSFYLKPFPPDELIRVARLLLGNPILRSA
jgi:DNA-binding response OmpR family regulator